jgi:hypothetical protein
LAKAFGEISDKLVLVKGNALGRTVDRESNKEGGLAKIGDLVSGAEVLSQPAERRLDARSGDNVVDHYSNEYDVVAAKKLEVNARVVFGTLEANFPKGHVEMLIPKEAGLLQAVHAPM